jgi:hypothetical protein
MINEAELREKLRKIEALFSGAGTVGERDAAAAARARVLERLKEAKKEKEDQPTEYKFSLNNQWSRKLFMALCRRYSLSPYRYTRQRYTTVMVRVSKEFVDTVLWPEFLELDKVLESYLSATAEKIIREEVYENTAEAEEVREVLSLPES